MTSNPHSEISTKPSRGTPAFERERALSKRLTATLADFSFREIARRTGYNPETVRRYLNGSSKIPADFVAQACRQFSCMDANDTLGTTVSAVQLDEALRRLPTRRLMVELGRRIELVEDNTVSKILLSNGATDISVSP